MLGNNVATTKKTVGIFHLEVNVDKIMVVLPSEVQWGELYAQSQPTFMSCVCHRKDRIHNTQLKLNALALRDNHNNDACEQHIRKRLKTMQNMDENVYKYTGDGGRRMKSTHNRLNVI